VVQFIARVWPVAPGTSAVALRRGEYGEAIHGLLGQSMSSCDLVKRGQDETVFDRLPSILSQVHTVSCSPSRTVTFERTSAPEQRRLPSRLDAGSSRDARNRSRDDQP